MIEPLGRQGRSNWRRRLDERSEPLRDLPHADADTSKRLHDWPAGTWPFIVKRYIESDIAIHVHVQFWPAENAESSDFCLTFECAVPDADLLESCSGLGWREVLDACVHEDARQVDELVPVEVRQTVEEPERVVLRLSVPSLKRLLVLDDCLMVVSQKADSLDNSIGEFSGDRIAKLVSLKKNGELDKVINDLLVIPRQLAGHEIESGPVVVESFSDEAAAAGRWLSAGEGFHDQIAGLRCEIMDNTMRVSVKESLDCPVQVHEVLCGPQQFVRDGVVRIRHEVNLDYARQEDPDTENPEGTRDTGSQAVGLREGSRRRGEAEEVTASTPEEVASQTSPDHRSGGCSATRTRLGSPEDA